MLRTLIFPVVFVLATAFTAIAQQQQAAITLAEPSPDQQAILAGVGNVQVPENLLPGAVCLHRLPFFGQAK